MPCILGGLLRQALHQRCPDDAGRVGVDRDAVLRQVPGGGLGKPTYRELGGRVQPDARVADVSGLGRRADDLAAVAQPLECLHGRLDAPHDAIEVDGEELLDALLGDLLDRGCRRDAGVVDNDVEAAQLGHGARNGSKHAVPVGDIDLDGDGAALFATKTLGDFGSGFEVQVSDRDPEAVCVKSLSDSLTDALATASDERDFSIERANHLPLLSFTLRVRQVYAKCTPER